MKSFIAIALAMCVAVIAVKADDNVCYDNVENACSSGKGLLPTCTSFYGGFSKNPYSVQKYLEKELSKSYEYLMLASYYSTYIKNRPGFQKLYQGLSDRSFDNTIELIKQVTRRGGEVSFTGYKSLGNKKFEVNELQSLALALDNEKELSTEAFAVHYMSTHAPHSKDRNDHVKHGANVDPEMAHFIEEKFLASQAESVRKLSGYVNDLGKLMKNDDPSLSVYMFDEYLQKA